MPRVRWDIDEDHLLAYRDYELVHPEGEAEAEDFGFAARAPSTASSHTRDLGRQRLREELPSDDATLGSTAPLEQSIGFAALAPSTGSKIGGRHPSARRSADLAA